MDLSWLATGLAIYLTILGLEVVDRTNMLVISLSAKRRPREVWIGASLAFVLSTAIAVTIGALFVNLLVQHLFYLRLAGGLFVISYGAWMLLRRGAEEEPPAPTGVHRTVLEAFLFVLLLEMGDDTQILTVLFVASTRNLLLVMVAASLGLVSTSAIGARAGGFLRQRLSPLAMTRISSVVIITVGLLLVVYAFSPF